MAQISRSDFAVGQNLHRSYLDGLSSTVKVFVSNTPRLQKGRLTPNPTVLQPLSAKMSVKVLAASVSKFPSRSAQVYLQQLAVGGKITAMCACYWQVLQKLTSPATAK